MIALIFCGDLKYCPYITRYIERLENAKADYRVFFWNRGQFELDLSDRYLWYDKGSKLTSGKLRKLFDFLGFRRWLFRQLRRCRPDGIIALSTLTGVFLGRALYRRKGDYIFDIRDYSYEHIGPFFRIEKKVIKNSAFTAISSRGFTAFLPEHDYVIAHNFNRNDRSAPAFFRKTDGPIRFVWNGVVRYFEFQKPYLNALKNDPRFEIVFHGDGPQLDSFREYCRESGFTNAFFTGSYNNRDKEKLLRDADILNNCYGYVGRSGNEIKYAVSNRFYDGMLYHIPQLVEPQGFKSEWVNEAGIGVSFPADESLADKLYEYYHGLNPVAFDDICEKELRRVTAEDDSYMKKIDAFIAERMR